MFSEFLRFYETHCRNAKSVIFITGRKESEFRKLTQLQLNPLTVIKPYSEFYYLEEKVNRTNEYFDWKIKEIHQILKKEEENLQSNLNCKKELKVKIYDDLVKYFSRVKKVTKKLDLRVEFFKIKEEKSRTPLL